MVFLGFGWRISFKAGQSLEMILVSSSSCSHSQLLVLKTCSGELCFPSNHLSFSPATTCSRVGQALGFCKMPADTLDYNRCCMKVFTRVDPVFRCFLTCLLLWAAIFFGPCNSFVVVHCGRSSDSFSRRCCLLPLWAPVMIDSYLLSPFRALSRTWSWFSLPTATLRSALTLIAVSGVNVLLESDTHFFPPVL